MSEPIDAPGNYRRIRTLERKVRRFQVKNYVLYAIALVAVVVSLLSVARVENLAHTNRGLLRQQAQGNLARCAATSAVIQAGRRAILNGKRPGDPEYGPRKRAADGYSNFIRNEVGAVTGRPLVVNLDGSLNCPALAPGAPQVPKATREIPKP